jgi:hypothetical protein
MPKLQDTENGESILIIPLVVREDTNSFSAIWWTPNGIMWPNEFSAQLGSVAASPAPPVGAIVAFWSHLSFPLGVPQSYIDSIAPGWQLCNGSSISSGPFVGSNTPNLNGAFSSTNTLLANLTANGTTTVTVNAGSMDDFYVGQEINWPGVFPAGTTVLQVSPISGGFVTRNLIMSAAATSSITNSAVQMSLNTFLKGSLTSPITGYGGKNSHQLTESEMPSHNHGGFTNTSGQHNHNTSTSFDTEQGGYGLARYSTNGAGSWRGGSTTGQAYIKTANQPWHYAGTKPSGSNVNSSVRDNFRSTSAWNDHNHTNLTEGLGTNSSNQPFAQPHNNMPHFFNVVYIMRVV